MNALEIKNFTKKYENFVAVDNLSLEIKKGEFFGFLGANGAGKTTTIHCITGINTITDGSIKVFGIDVDKEYKKARTKVGLSPQEFNIDIFLTIEKILWYNGGLFNMKKEEREKRIEELLKILELETHRKKQFRQLSGGLKRRVMLARALMHDPDLLILDEPTAGVDVELRHELWEYLKKINAAGKTILLTSHYLEEVELLCNRIAIIDNGKIIAVGDKSEFVKDGKSLEKKYLELTQKTKSS
ncbi:MAG: ABC transporter [Candidatus Magasanikbacteria bacterium CG11_big_fil_rev_8_21_14_0_20_39_34]|uniref:ABC transporter n=1 Tax=Candidatus Magasanikbacteria bacterium CG11_big_fil_rev_8_21_14_0_20_39_34 TaxID=1974653 RepID=A0A2H0N6E9_9BACT|nr:MAG: ABC transporter [Candidatus Magasanikbacteria bacterium CG11_big_fil_rev_8_21_14_0_20_39_34]